MNSLSHALNLSMSQRPLQRRLRHHVAELTDGEVQGAAAFLQPRRVLPSHLTETISAVYGFVPSWPERDSGVDATLRANHRMHLSRSTIAPSDLVPTGTPTRRATGRFVGETLLREELLFTYREYEG